VDLYFSDEFDKVIAYARDEAMRTGHKIITPDHLLLGLLRFREGDAVACLAAYGMDLDAVKRSLDAVLFRKQAVSWSEYDLVVLAPESQNVISLAMVDAGLLGSVTAQPIHLLSAVCKYAGCFGSGILKEFGFTASNVSAFVKENLGAAAMPAITPEASEIAMALERELNNAISQGKLKPIVFS